MKYGIYYAYWEKQWGADYIKYVEKVSKLGFDILEISCAGLKDKKEDEIKALKEAAQKYSIILTGGYGPKKEENIAADDENTIFLQPCFTAEFNMLSVPVILLTEYFSGAIIDSPAALNAAR